MNPPGNQCPAEYSATVSLQTRVHGRHASSHPAMGRATRGFGVNILILLIEVYRRLVSPFFPPSCRYQPSCSRYAQDALRKHGLLRGTRLAVGRVLRCHPWHGGGWDPVP